MLANVRREAAQRIGDRVRAELEELAMAGASDAEIMSQLEHATDRAAKIYRRQADRRRMADAGQDRIDNVVSIREQRKAKDAANGR